MWVLRVRSENPLPNLRRGVREDAFDGVLGGGQQFEEPGEQRASLIGVGAHDQWNLVRRALAHRLERVQGQELPAGGPDGGGAEHVG